MGDSSQEGLPGRSNTHHTDLESVDHYHQDDIAHSEHELPEEPCVYRDTPSPVSQGQGENDHGATEESLLLREDEHTHVLGRFARKDILSRYIPELDPDHARAITLRVKMAKRTTMLRIQLTTSILVVLLNGGFFIWLLVRYPADMRGVGTFTYSDCGEVGLLNSSVHVALNIVSSLFLAAGNYCMQIMVSPSREEIESAGRKGRALEIGVPSVTNLRSIQWGRVALWAGLGLLSTLLHLFWNSAIFTSTPLVAVPRAIVTSDFMSPGTENWTATDPLRNRDWWHFAPEFGAASQNTTLIYGMQGLAPTLDRLTTRECIERNIDPLTASSGVIAVARNMTSAQFNGSTLLDGWVSGWEAWGSSASWICSAHQKSSKREDQRFCNAEWAEAFADSWVLHWGDKWTIEVDYCLGGEPGNNSTKCGLHYSAHIWAIVSVCTLLECLLVLVVWLKHRRDGVSKDIKEGKMTMVTMGDAIQSFLKQPDEITTDASMETRADQEGGSPRQPGAVTMKKGHWTTIPRVRWLKAVSTPTWVMSYACFVTGLLVPASYIGRSIQWLAHIGVDMSFGAVWKRGFRVHPAAIVSDFEFLHLKVDRSANLLLGHVLVANSPQLLMSILYLFYNNILTRQLVADEWLRFLRPEGKKTLRVSSPIGLQRSSYFLSLPLTYSAPLLGLTTLLHWLISQSMFLVQSSVFGPGAAWERMPALDSTSRGYSVLGSLAAIGLALVLILAIGVHGALRSYKNVPPGFVRMGHNSAAIQALCRRAEDDCDAHLFPLSIGMVEDQTSRDAGCAGRMVFSTDTMLNQEPDPEKEYLMPCPAKQDRWAPTARMAKRWGQAAKASTSRVSAAVQDAVNDIKGRRKEQQWNRVAEAEIDEGHEMESMKNTVYYRQQPG